MRYTKSNVLRAAIRIAEKGPSLWDGPQRTDLSQKVRDEIDHGIRLWLDSWILPAMRANLPRPKVKNDGR